ncbi:MAG TPA: ATP-binding protein [Solirubrobacteraceae bacterium]|nr:ATP-binding protein [Solirubrobacteraceae bacterium]
MCVPPPSTNSASRPRSALAQRAARNGVDVSLSVHLADRSAHRFELDTAVYRIVQEALTNAQKHGHAHRVRVDVHESDELIDVGVRDDGVGFDPRARTNGLGLLGIRERVELFGRTLCIHSSPGRGATVSATLPVGDHATATLPLSDHAGPTGVARAGRAA